MSATVQELRMVADLLRKNNAHMGEFSSRSSPIDRRRVIHDFGKQNGYTEVVNKIVDRESIRLYVEDVEGLDSPHSDNTASYQPLQMQGAGPQPAGPQPAGPQPVTPNSKDNTMNSITKTQAITVTTQINVNGVNYWRAGWEPGKDI